MFEMENKVCVLLFLEHGHRHVYDLIQARVQAVLLDTHSGFMLLMAACQQAPPSFI